MRTTVFIAFFSRKGLESLLKKVSVCISNRNVNREIKISIVNK